ncbi:MAG: hypothetical protein WD042_18350 [Phycisphaeraceae bacterium]
MLAIALALALTTPVFAADLPVAGDGQHLRILLQAEATPAEVSDPAVRQYAATITARDNTEYVTARQSDVVAARKGMADTTVAFRYQLDPAIAPGQYVFHARYQCGGEPGQVPQTFIVRAGPDAQSLEHRATFKLTNKIPWQFQWVTPGAGKPLMLFAEDRVLEIRNQGRAHDSKVFDAFTLKLEADLPPELSGETGRLRRRLLGLIQQVQKPQKRLLVLDGGTLRDGNPLLAGLTAESNHAWYGKAEVRYILGDEAQQIAGQMNLSPLPAAVVSDARYTVLGTLTASAGAKQAQAFLLDPAGHGVLPTPAPVTPALATALRKGVPRQWLIGDIHDGRAGMSIYGIDTEKHLRPNPGTPYLETRMMGGAMRTWQPAPTTANGVLVIEQKTHHPYGWSRGTGYAQLYLHVDEATSAVLHLQQSGIKTVGWLDGVPVAFEADAQPPSDFPKPGDRGQKLLEGFNTEGNVQVAVAEKAEPAQAAKLQLSPGWHRLTIKLTMQHDRGETFFMAARFTDAEGGPINSITTQVSDPQADLAAHAHAARLRPLIYVDAPANLPYPGDPLQVRAVMTWNTIREETRLDVPILPFAATLRLIMTDYDGHEIAVREAKGTFPGEVTVDFGTAPDAGYYAIHPAFYGEDGKLIMAYHSDGFSVVRGSAAQRERLDQKKLWNNWYYAFDRWPELFTWLERTGIYKNLGSAPGYEERHRLMWEAAKDCGIVLFADSLGDSGWLNDSPEAARQFFAAVAPYTRYFKSANEIDSHPTQQMKKVRNPQQWVARAKWEYQAIKAANPDAVYVGGSICRPADMGGNDKAADGMGSGKWFAQVLALGLDQYQDAWDVHTYPQVPPRFGGPFGNGAKEDEQGVLLAYKNAGRENKLPFWYGEIAAKAAHGADGRRWQGQCAAKIVAWLNHRPDVPGGAFCIANEYDWGYGRLWDYSKGHKPAEAALYTVGALIDGFPYKPVSGAGGDESVQAAWFGDTFMIWRTDEAISDYQLQLDGPGPWVVVDVVGRLRPLEVNDGQARLPISASPVYVLTKERYERLTRFE